jgi:hypothetical protein
MTKVPDTKENMMKCVCMRCPTYQQSDCPKSKMEGLFCAKGQSSCELEEKGCICGTCPVWDEYGLSKGYFCLHGKAE